MKSESRKRIDLVIAYDILRRLLTPARESEAFRLGIINAKGELTRDPKTKEEKESYSLLDLIIWQFQNLLGTRIQYFRRYIFLNNFNNTIVEKLVIRNETSIDYLDRLQFFNSDFSERRRSKNFEFDEMNHNN